jgi:hypothetical protein
MEIFPNICWHEKFELMMKRQLKGTGLQFLIFLKKIKHQKYLNLLKNKMYFFNKIKVFRPCIKTFPHHTPKSFNLKIQSCCMHYHKPCINSLIYPLKARSREVLSKMISGCVYVWGCCMFSAVRTPKKMRDNVMMS